MPYLIDGNNLIGVFSSLEVGSQKSREIIIRKLAKFHKITKKRIVLVFDGAPDPYPSRFELYPKSFLVLFPNFGESADEVIKRLISPGMILVSSDRELIEEARRRRLKWMRSREFLRVISSVREEDRGKPIWNPTPQEIEAWLKIFGKK